MAATKWSGYFIYKAKHKDIDSVLKGSFIPVSSFSVKGGATRIIIFDGADDISLVSEIEQARRLKNISLHLPPTKNFEWLDLTEIAMHRLQFSMSFYVRGEVRKELTHEFSLFSSQARISQLPVKGFSPGYGNTLKVAISLPETRLVHGAHEGNSVVNEDW